MDIIFLIIFMFAIMINEKQNITMKGITLIITEPLSEKTKEKLRKLSENQKKRLEQLKKCFINLKRNKI